jgi:hypothetical protein
MAKYDYGGGCPCGLYAECIPQCEHAPQKIICDCGPNGYCNCVKAKKAKKMEKNSNDFGFSMVDDVEIFANAPYDTKAEELRDMIMPLLNNLKLNPEKDYIQWKGAERVKQIDAFIKKMNSLIDG